MNLFIGDAEFRGPDGSGVGQALWLQGFARFSPFVTAGFDDFAGVEEAVDDSAYRPAGLGLRNMVWFSAERLQEQLLILHRFLEAVLVESQKGTALLDHPRECHVGDL